MRTLTLAILLLSAPVLAEDVNCEQNLSGQAALSPVIAVAQMAASGTCPNARRLRHICMSIDDRVEDPQPLASHYKFEYERMILEGACVNLQSDSREVQRQKIQALWRQAEGQLVCNSPRFGIQNGSIIKYAMNSLFDDFIENVLNWGVNLNKVDEDGQTPLDFLRDRINRSGSNSQRRLQAYYDQLRAAGAKHRSEL